MRVAAPRLLTVVRYSSISVLLLYLLAGCGSSSSSATPSALLPSVEATPIIGTASPTGTTSGANRNSYSEAWEVAFSPNGQTIAAGYAALGFGAQPQNPYVVRLWHLDRPDDVPTLLTGHTGDIASLAISPNGQYLAAGGGDDSRVLVWNLNQPDKAPHAFVVATSAMGIAFSPDSRYLAAGGAEDTTVRLWDMQNPGADPILLNGDDYTGEVISFSPDGKTLAVGEQRGVRIWGGSSYQTLLTTLPSLNGSPIWALAFSPDGQTLAEGGVERTIRLWGMQNPSKPSQIARLVGHTDTVRGLAFSPDGSVLASGSRDGTVRLWNMHNFDVPPTKLSGQIGSVEEVAFSPDGRRLAAVWGDPKVWLWNLDQPNAVPTPLVP